MLARLADDNHIKWQTKGRITGGTDASAIQRSREGVRTGALACAVRNIHSHACIAKIKDFDDMLELARLFLEEVAND